MYFLKYVSKISHSYVLKKCLEIELLDFNYIISITITVCFRLSETYQTYTGIFKFIFKPAPVIKTIAYF